MFMFERDNKINIQFNNNLPTETPDVIIWQDETGVHAKIGDQQIDGALTADEE